MSRKGGPERSPELRAYHQAEIQKLYFQHVPQVKIGEILHLSQSQVSNDLKALEERWFESADVDFKEARAKELARIDNLEREAWDAWIASKGETSRTTQFAEADEHGQPKPKRASTVKQKSNGDPKFLDTLKWCIEMRSKITGLLAPEKHEHSGALTLMDLVLQAEKADVK